MPASAKAHIWKILAGRIPRWIRVSGEKAAQFNPGTNVPITVSIWARGHSYPIRSYETMISKGDTSWTLQRVQYSSGQGYQCCVRTPGYHLCAYNFAGQGLVTNEWLHFMVVLEAPGMKLYINGQLNASQSAGPWNKGNHGLGIGNQTQNLGSRYPCIFAAPRPARRLPRPTQLHRRAWNDASCQQKDTTSRPFSSTGSCCTIVLCQKCCCRRSYRFLLPRRLWSGNVSGYFGL